MAYGWTSGTSWTICSRNTLVSLKKKASLCDGVLSPSLPPSLPLITHCGSSGSWGTNRSYGSSVTLEGLVVEVWGEKSQSMEVTD